MPRNNPNDEQSDVIVIKVSRRLWYALKRVQVDAPTHQAVNTRSFRTELDAIALGDNELLGLLRRAMRARV